MAMTYVLLVVVYGLFGLCIPTGLLCILQYILSKMESPWPGRVLPILSGLFTLVMTGVVLLNMAHVGGILMTAVLALLLLSIPTVLYIVIYRCTRRKYRTQRDMEKMSIQDLE